MKEQHLRLILLACFIIASTIDIMLTAYFVGKSFVIGEMTVYFYERNELMLILGKPLFYLLYILTTVMMVWVVLGTPRQWEARGKLVKGTTIIILLIVTAFRGYSALHNLQQATILWT